MVRRPRTVLAALAVLAPLAVAALPADAALKALPNTPCTVFPADNWWHADVSKLPVHVRSKAWLSHMSPTSKLHPDFGPSYGAQPVPYGIPITYVSGSHAKVSVSFQYSAESDHVGYPLGSDTKIEGGSHASGDRHAIIVDKTTCHVYETWLTKKAST